MKHFDHELSKGIFWFICSFDENEACDFSETEMITQLVPCSRDGRAAYSQDFNSRKGDGFNHKAAWPLLVRKRKDLRKHAWNYFPRGRVEVAGSKAVIYLNINILQYPGFRDAVTETFHLEGVKTKVVVDNSRHYFCHADDVRIQ